MNERVTSTKITEFLDVQGVPYTLLHHQSPAISIEDAAQQRGISPHQMVKTILLRDMDNNYTLACVPGNMQADPKKVRAILNCRRMTCVELSDVPSITGYAPGTVAPLLLPSKMNIFFDSRFRELDSITISSGSNMAGIAMETTHLIALCEPIFADITR
ncbi:YbaK/EbsC family protein [Vibrio hannami]|uniref:aminoacyl-tRNA deacylase n=1 Tax=Vibrio hannami TaxID=2717094 RepID=UPI0024101A0E|nr:YbaK/EbsC family protein [Vibrio hannami]MDG3087142.1 YbaK/EbsC family protein [Vibrio hannami]